MTSDQRVLLPLRHVDASSVSNLPSPSQKIRSEEDVHAWRLTRGYQDYELFLRRLNESVVGHMLPWTSPTAYPVSFFPVIIGTKVPSYLREQEIDALMRMLETLDRWIDEIPPLPTPQRFGNLAFRTWGQRLQDVSQSRYLIISP